MSELDDLIAAVESGTFVCNDALSPRANENVAYRAFSGSLDAALALHEALLPDFRLENISESDWKRGDWWASLHRPVEGNEKGEITRHGETHTAFDQPSPARAWLLAILRAYRQQRDGQA